MTSIGSAKQLAALIGIVGAVLVVGGLLNNLKYFDSGYDQAGLDQYLPVVGVLVLLAVPIVVIRGGVAGWRASRKDIPFLIVVTVIISCGVAIWGIVW